MPHVEKDFWNENVEVSFTAFHGPDMKLLKFTTKHVVKVTELISLHLMVTFSVSLVVSRVH